jgi:SagB-type dehydrogenase family enzyme
MSSASELINLLRKLDHVERILVCEDILTPRPEEYDLSKMLPDDYVMVKRYSGPKINLPEPREINVPISYVIKTRRSCRSMSGDALTLNELSDILYYGYGITGRIDAYGVKDFPLHAAPTAGALQSIEVYVLALNVEGIPPGAYHYNYLDHTLEQIYRGFIKYRVLDACYGQEFIQFASAVIVLTGNIRRGVWKYKSAYYKFMLIDAGCVVENMHLVAHALGLCSCIVAGFDKEKVRSLLYIDDRLEMPLIMIAVGRKQK